MQRRLDRVLDFWDKGKALSANNIEYRDFVNKLFDVLLKNDLKEEDLTTDSIIKDNKNITAYIVAKEDGIMAGLEEFSLLNKDLKLNVLKKDGDKIRKDDILLEINGNAKKILKKERLNLNLLQRMSGIATLTNSLNEKLKGKTKIAATRKILWGLLDKKAVSVGGGLTHRLNLNDGVIIKDNHLKVMNYDFEKIIDTATNNSKYIEIEVENRLQAISAASAIKNSIKKCRAKNVFAIMFDKIKPLEIKSILNELKKIRLYGEILFEASGNITKDNLNKYRDCGVDVISMGFITNSAKPLNISQEIR